MKSKTRKEMQEIVKQAPDLFEALAKAFTYSSRTFLPSFPHFHWNL